MFGLELGIDTGQLACGKFVECSDRFVELVAHYIGTRKLLFGGPAFILADVAVEFAEVFAQPLFAGDRSTFFSGHYLGADRIERLCERDELCFEWILSVEFGCIRRSFVANVDDRVDRPAHVVEHGAEPYSEGELLLAVFEGVGGAWIHHDVEFGGVDLNAFCHLHRIHARQHAWPLRRLEHSPGGGWDSRALYAHRPGGAIDTAVFAACDGVDEISLFIEYLNLEIAEDVAASLVVRDGRVLWTGRPMEGVVALRPSALSLHVLNDRRNRKEFRLISHEFGGERAPGGDVVDDPDAAPVGGKHEVRGLGVNDKIANGDVGKVAALVLGPSNASIVADPETKLSAEEEQVGIDRVLFDNVRVPAHAARLSIELLPCLTVVDGFEEVRLRVAAHVGIEGGVGGSFVVAACLYPGNDGRAADARDVRR